MRVGRCAGRSNEAACNEMYRRLRGIIYDHSEDQEQQKQEATGASVEGIEVCGDNL